MTGRRKFVREAFALLWVVAGCGGGGSSEPPPLNQWLMLGHGYTSTYSNPAETAVSVASAPQLRALWHFDARGQVYGAPVVGSALYVTATGGVYAFDAASGDAIWENLEIGATSSFAYNEGTLFVHDLRSFLRALDPATGEELWATRTDSHPLAAGTSSPVVFEHFVVVGISSNEIVREGATFRGGVAAFDRYTGEMLWRNYTADPPHNGAAVWSTVSIDVETRVVFAGSGQNYTGEAGPDSDALFALDLDTGERLWTRQTVEGDVFTPVNPMGPDADFGANPILFEAIVDGVPRKLVGAGQKNGMFWVFDRATGADVWSRELGLGSPLTGGVLNNGAFDGQRILVANNDPRAGHATLFALDPGSGAILWQRPLADWVWAPITVANGVGFVAADKNLVAFDVRTGSELFTFATDGTIACTPVVAGGRVHFGSGMQHIVGTPGRRLHVLGLTEEPGIPTPSPSPVQPGGDSFTAVYEIFVNQGCNTALCHGGSAGNLSMPTRDDAYGALVGAAAAGGPCAASGAVLVVPGDVSASLLWDKIATRTPACGEPMPISTALSAGELEQIRQWIERGAPND